MLLVDRAELLKAGAAEDPLAHLRRHGRRLDAPAYEGWFHDMAELYFQSRHRLRVGTASTEVQQVIGDLGERDLSVSVFTGEDRPQAERIAEVDPSAAELRRFHTEFLDENRFPGWPERPDELEVAGLAMRAWARAYPRLIEEIGPRTALVIAWEADASADRVRALVD